jgi:hypothetical protein
MLSCLHLGTIPIGYQNHKDKTALYLLVTRIIKIRPFYLGLLLWLITEELVASF